MATMYSTTRPLMRICPQFMGPSIRCNNVGTGSGSGSRRSSHTPHTYTCTAMRTASVHRHTHHCGHMQEQASTKPQGQRCPLITSRTYETTKHTSPMTTSMRRALGANPSASTLPPRKKVGTSFAPGHQAKMSLNLEDEVPLKKLTLDSFRE